MAWRKVGTFPKASIATVLTLCMLSKGREICIKCLMSSAPWDAVRRFLWPCLRFSRLWRNRSNPYTVWFSWLVGRKKFRYYSDTLIITLWMWHRSSNYKIRLWIEQNYKNIRPKNILCRNKSIGILCSHQTNGEKLNSINTFIEFKYLLQ